MMMNSSVAKLGVSARLNCFVLVLMVIGCQKQSVPSTTTDLTRSEVLKLDYTSDLKIFRGEYLTSSTLLANQDRSKFYYTTYPAAELMGELIRKEWGEMQDIVEGDPEGAPLYSNKRTSLIHWKASPGIRNPILVDTLGISTPQWVMGDSAKVCGEFGICRQATADWYGRHYRAWYLPKYPIPFGPYKFHGLPGAVYSVASDDGKVRFTLTSVNALEIARASLEVPAEVRPISFARHRENVFRNFLDLDNQGFLMTLEPSDPDMLIERERFMYASEYLEQHGNKASKQ